MWRAAARCGQWCLELLLFIWRICREAERSPPPAAAPGGAVCRRAAPAQNRWAEMNSTDLS